MLLLIRLDLFYKNKLSLKFAHAVIIFDTFLALDFNNYCIFI